MTDTTRGPNRSALDAVAYGTDVEPAAQAEHRRIGSPLRLEGAARAALDHSVQFGMTDAATTAVDIIASAVTDLLVLADALGADSMNADISAAETLERVRDRMRADGPSES